MKRLSLPLAAALLCSCRAGLPSRAPSADLLIYNGRVFARAEADAVLVRDGRIAAVGKEAELRARAPAAGVLDAGGGLVIPGFHDAHVHLMDGGISSEQLDLEGLKTMAAVQESIRAWAAAHPELPVILGRGWAYEIVPKGEYPSLRQLDAAESGRPVILESYDGHAYWINSAAARRARLDASVPDPEGGRIVRAADGSPQGAFIDAGEFLLARAEVLPGHEEMRRGILRGLDYLLALGFTSADVMISGLAEAEVYRELEAAGRLPLRLRLNPPLEGDLDAYARLRAQLTGPMLGFGFLKGFVDGVIESRTAYMLEPYPDSAERGRSLFAPGRLEELVDKAHSRGFAVALHAIGDAAVRASLDAFAAAAKAHPAIRPRHRIEHIETVHPADMGRFKALGVAASMQPLHADPGGPEPDAGIWAQNLGPERLKRSFAWRSLRDAGAVLAFGSDWPVMSADPLRGIALAATRRSREGQPEGGWQPEQTITPAEALRAYTFGPAWALGVENELGSIAPGQRADLVILSPEFRLEEPRSAWSARVRAVIVDGSPLPRR